ncbi:MAG: glycosyltransferase family 4 protein [Candidatus Sumerlaeia bacterium]|nr:glycosyltransferase family 4 protein [Candidatus Sumerlaeia bacterium]
MRVLFANERLGWFGGVEQNVADTAHGLRGRGHECVLAFGARTDRDPDGYASNFASVQECRDLGGNGPPLADIARDLRADAIYLHKIARIPARSSFAREARVVRYIHDHDLCCPRRHKYFAHNGRICEHPAGWRCWLDLAFIERGAAGIAYRHLPAHLDEMRANHGLDAFLVGSRFMREELAMNGFPADRLRIVPPVVRREASAPTPPPDAPNVLFVGQLIRGKGVDLLLDALALLGPAFRARIAGTGNADSALRERCAQLGLADRVEFLGWIANAELEALYDWARVVAVPSRWAEPFGMIGLEAMRRARPVVACAAGGIPDWLVDGGTGILCPVGDARAFAVALERVLGDQELAARMGGAAYLRGIGEYSFDRYLDRIEAALGIGGGE